MIPFEKNKEFVCPICERIVPLSHVEKHHLIPKAKKGKDTINLCCNCGDMIHKTIPNNELKRSYNTVEKLKQHPEMKKWIKWISKRPNQFSVCMAHKKRKK